MNLALFDFDGTITRTDTWTEFLRFSATRRRLVAAAVVLSPVMVAYRLGWITGRQGRPVTARVAFAGRDASIVRDAGRRYAQERLPHVVRPRALERIEWHKQQGDTIVVVSASLDAYLRPWCESLGVDVICTRLEENGRGTLTGRYLQGDCCGAEKTRRIRERYDLAHYGTVYAYGDTEEDREMLEMAHEKYYRWERIDDCRGLSPRHPRTEDRPRN